MQEIPTLPLTMETRTTLLCLVSFVSSVLMRTRSQKRAVASQTRPAKTGSSRSSGTPTDLQWLPGAWRGGAMQSVRTGECVRQVPRNESRKQTRLLSEYLVLMVCVKGGQVSENQLVGCVVSYSHDKEE